MSIFMPNYDYRDIVLLTKENTMPRKQQLILTLTPELSALINQCVAKRVSVNGHYMSRQKFITDLLTKELTKFLYECLEVK